VLNQTVVLFDNDAAARVSFNEAVKMALPINMRVLLLPKHSAGGSMQFDVRRRLSTPRPEIGGALPK
jgi:hypothetical protein